MLNKIFKNITDMSDYDNMLREDLIHGWFFSEEKGKFVCGKRTRKEYFREEKGLEFEIKVMTPDEYLEQAAYIHKATVEWEKEFIIDELVSEYKERVLLGELMPMPVLNYADMSQEGRHRAVVAKVLGCTEIPVMIVTKRK